MKINDIYKAVVSLWNYYETCPKGIKNPSPWALRRALSPYMSFPCWITLNSGARIYLGFDPIDDLILEDMIGKFTPLFFPNEFDERRNEKFILMDIGSHHGIYATEILMRYPKAEAILVEPVSESISFVKKNLQANHLFSRTRIVEGGLGTEDGWAYIESADTGSWSDKTVAEAQDGSEKVQIFSVKTALQGSLPDFVKCNAEGAEFTVFPQLFELGIKPKLVILMAHPEYGSVEELLDLFKENGYIVRDAGSTAKRIRLHCLLSPSVD
jgi:FkbM family methyltransferase